MQCPNCNQKIKNNSAVCPYCQQSFKKKHKKKKDTLTTAASFFNPCAGFLMWMHYEDKDSQKSKKVGVAALIGKLFVYAIPFIALLVAWLVLKHLGS